MFDPKGASDAIVGKITGPPKDDEVGFSDAGLHSAAEDVLKAIHQHKADDLVSALRAFYEMCDTDSGGGDGE